MRKKIWLFRLFMMGILSGLSIPVFAEVYELGIVFTHKTYPLSTDLRNEAEYSRGHAERLGEVKGATMALQSVNAAIAASVGYEFQSQLTITIELTSEGIQRFCADGIHPILDLTDKNSSIPPKVIYHHHYTHINDGEREMIKKMYLDSGKEETVYYENERKLRASSWGTIFIKTYNRMLKALQEKETFPLKEETQNDETRLFRKEMRGSGNDYIQSYLQIDKNRKWIRVYEGSLQVPVRMQELKFRTNDNKLPESVLSSSEEVLNEFDVQSIRPGDVSKFHIPEPGKEKIKG